MKVNRKKLGKWLLAAGCLLLAAAILCAFAFGTVAVPILLVSSILVNSAGVLLIRGK